MAHGVFTLGSRVDHADSVRLTREAARICVLGAGLLLASLASAAAQDPHSEIFTGLEASNNAVSGYLGAGYAFGKGLYERGWPVRAVGALGRYDYQGTLFGAGADLGTIFDGEASYGAALVGYQFRTQILFLKLFAGVEAEDQPAGTWNRNRERGTRNRRFTGSRWGAAASLRIPGTLTHTL